MGSEQGVQENKETEKRHGEVKIASDVVATIAGFAANEVEGVDSMSGNIRFGVKNRSKGVRVTMEGECVRVDIHLNMKYGYSIPEVVEQVQERVSQQIETMTGLRVIEVNVRIVGVHLNEN